MSCHRPQRKFNQIKYTRAWTAGDTSSIKSNMLVHSLTESSYRTTTSSTCAMPHARQSSSPHRLSPNLVVMTRLGGAFRRHSIIFVWRQRVRRTARGRRLDRRVTSRASGVSTQSSCLRTDELSSSLRRPSKRFETRNYDDGVCS